MALFEFEQGRLIPAQFGRPIEQGLEPDILNAIRSQVLEVIARPLFPVTWHNDDDGAAEAVGSHRLTALDASGQVVSVELMTRLDPVSLIAALARLGDIASLGWMDLAARFPGGPDAFRAGWTEFREQMPPTIQPGPRLIIVTGEIDPAIRPALGILYKSALEIHEIRLRQMSNGRRFIEVVPVRPDSAADIAALPSGAHSSTLPEIGWAEVTDPAPAGDGGADGDVAADGTVTQATPHDDDGADEGDASKATTMTPDSVPAEGADVMEQPADVRPAEGITASEPSDDNNDEDASQAAEVTEQADMTEAATMDADSVSEDEAQVADSAEQAEVADAASDEADTDSAPADVSDEQSELDELPDLDNVPVTSGDRGEIFDAPAVAPDQPPAPPAPAPQTTPPVPPPPAPSSSKDTAQQSDGDHVADLPPVPGILGFNAEGLQAIAAVIGQDAVLVSRDDQGTILEALLKADGTIDCGNGFVTDDVEQAYASVSGRGDVVAWQTWRIGHVEGPTLAEAIDEINAEIYRESQEAYERKMAKKQ